MITFYIRAHIEFNITIKLLFCSLVEPFNQAWYCPIWRDECLLYLPFNTAIWKTTAEVSMHQHLMFLRVKWMYRQKPFLPRISFLLFGLPTKLWVTGKQTYKIKYFGRWVCLPFPVFYLSFIGFGWEKVPYFSGYMFLMRTSIKLPFSLLFFGTFFFV